MFDDIIFERKRNTNKKKNVYADESIKVPEGQSTLDFDEPQSCGVSCKDCSCPCPEPTAEPEMEVAEEEPGMEPATGGPF